MSGLQRALSFLLFLALLSLSPAGGVEVNRRILILFDGEEGAADRSRGHRYLEMPINRAGLTAEYFDASLRPLPDPSRYRGLAAWFQDDRLADPAGFCSWLTGAIRKGVRVLVMNGAGALRSSSGDAVREAVLRAPEEAFGLLRSGAIPFTDNPVLIQTEVRVPEHFGFETRRPLARPNYLYLQAARTDLHFWKVLRRTDVPKSESPVIAAGTKGVWVTDERHAVRFVETPVYHAEWDVNPFALVEAAFGTDGLPRPDVTTAFGSRAAFAHIDGDGMDNFSQDLPGPPRKASQVVRDEILTRYPIPTTVGLVGARVDPKGLGSSKALPLWRSIMALPHVQNGCHGYGHPFIWAKGDVGLPVPGYRFSEAGETYDAMTLLERLVLPAGERVEVFLWTGDCAPTAKAIAEVERYGALHMNGGNPRYDALYNSVSFIAALSRPVGEYRQTYAPAGNEYLYTDGWTENFGGFRHILDTFERTESPRLLPVNLYYHFYLAERQAGLRSLRTICDWLMERPLCWIHAAEYIRSVQGFHTLRLTRLADGGWRVSEYGECRTLRFDGRADGIDLARSRNVLGFTRHAGSLYVALAPGAQADLYPASVPPARFALRRSPGRLRKVSGSVKAWRAEARLYAAGTLELWTPAPGTIYSVSLPGGETVSLTSDERGLLCLPLPEGRGEWKEVRVGR